VWIKAQAVRVDVTPLPGSTTPKIGGTHIRSPERANFGIRSVLRRSFCIALLAFQFLFLNVVIPGHRRGVIPLSGAASVSGMADLGCSLCGQPSAPPAPGKASKSGSPQSCAICTIAAHLMLPPAFQVLLAALGLLMCPGVLTPARVETLRFIPTYFGRAPPASRI